ncbi:MAG: autotransporter-associated beta strand repeat-containing protein [Lentisphaeria bacterium]
MKLSLTILAATLLLLGLASTTPAATFTWNGGGDSDTNWSTGINWTDSNAPANDGTADIAMSHPSGTWYDSTIDQAWSVKTITFSGAYATLKGQPLTIANTITNSIAVSKLQNDLVLGNHVTVYANYGILLIGTAGGTITAANKNLQIRGGNSADVSSAINLGTGAVSITTATTNAVFRNANSSYSGGTSIWCGTLSIDSIADQGVNSAIGTGAIYLGQNASGVNGTGTLKFNGASGGSSNRNFYLLSNASGSSTGIIENTVAGQTLALSGDFVYDSTSGSQGAWKFTGSGNGLVSGNITTTGASLAKEGTGTWKLTGNNTYGGGTTVSVGTLLVSNTLGSGTGSGNVTVASGATLGGTGIIDPGTGNSVTINGILAPGESAGTLTVGSLGSTNDVFLSGTYSADLGDLLKVYGALSLGGSSILTLSGSPTPGTNYTLASYTGGLTGTFATINNLPDGWQVTYGGNAITLGLIPEPVSLALLAAGGLLLGARRRVGPR